jgi:hypothetical protein
MTDKAPRLPLLTQNGREPASQRVRWITDLPHLSMVVEVIERDARFSREV